MANNLWFKSVAAYVVVIFSMWSKPIYTSSTIIVFLFGRSIKISIVLIRAQCSTPPISKDNFLTSFLSLTKPSTCLKSSTLPSLQSVYNHMLILYNFWILIA